MLIFQSHSMDVYRNLAIEEYLMDHVTGHGPVLFLWQSACAVVLGKNQNPWCECRLDRMRADGVPLARRISGGGTVYHDAGNLNHCVIVDRNAYREEQAYEMVFRALSTFGITAEKTGKSNLSVDGMKFSGNAFSFRKGRALHHGTLLLHTNLERLNRYLGSRFGRIETRAIASEPAEVANLELKKDPVAAALKASFEALYGDGALFRFTGSDVKTALLDPLLEKQQSTGWQYGTTPKFTLEYAGVKVDVAKGLIVSAEGAGTTEWAGKPFAETAILWGYQVD